MASKYRKLFKVHQEFENILNDFAKEILRNQPRDIYDFGIKYFGALEDGIELDYPDKGDNLPCSYKRPTKKREIIRAINKMEMSIEDQGRFHRSMEKIERMHQYDLPKRDPDPNIEIEGDNDVKIVKVPDKIVTDKEIDINNYKINENGEYEEFEENDLKDSGGKGASREISHDGNVGGTASRPESDKDVKEKVTTTKTVVKEVIVNGEVVQREVNKEVYDDSSDNKGNLDDQLNDLDENKRNDDVPVNEPEVTDVNVNIEDVNKDLNNKNSGEGSNGEMEEPDKQKEDEEDEKEEGDKQKEDGSKGDHITPKGDEGSPEEEEPKQEEEHYEDNFDRDEGGHQDDEQEISDNKFKGDEDNHEEEYEEPKEGEEDAPNGSVTEEELKKQNKILEQSKKDEEDNNIRKKDSKDEEDNNIRDKEKGEDKKEKEEDANYEEPDEDSFAKELTESQQNFAKKDKTENEDENEDGDKSEEGDKFGEEQEQEDKKGSGEDIIDNDEGKIRRRPSLMKQLSSKIQVGIEDKKSNLAEIIKVTGIKTTDKRGKDAIEVEVTLSGGIKEKVIIPSRPSKEGEEKEKGGNEKEVDEAVKNVNEIIAPVIEGMGALNQIDIDKKIIELDGTKNKSKLGSNATLAVSLAVSKAASVFLRIPLYRYIGGISAKILPVPCMNVIKTNNGESTIDFKEYFIIPAGFKTYKEAHQAGQDIYNELKNVMQNHGYDIGDDDGFKPLFKEGNGEVFKLITEAVNNTQYKLGENIFLGFNVAASRLYDGNSYNLKNSNEGEKSSDEMIDYIEEIVNEYPSIITIEDGLAGSDWEGWKKLTERLGNRVQLVGDDLFVTNTKKLKYGIDNKIANSILIKVNQIGTITETLDAVEMAKRAGYTAVISHRSGESEDTTIADLAVGLNAGLIKTGSLSRTDRIAKYNQLLRIEDELDNIAKYDGLKSFYNVIK